MSKLDNLFGFIIIPIEKKSTLFKIFFSGMILKIKV